jgi:hypothetical protein
MPQIEYMHYRPKQRNLNGGATVAIMPVDGTVHALVALSQCGPLDTFNKKIGRNVSAGRLRAYLEGRESASINRYVKTITISDPLYLKKSVAEALAAEMDENGLE